MSLAPASVKAAVTVTVPPSASVVGDKTTGPSTGDTLFTRIEASLVTAALNGSETVSVASTSASSLHAIVGVSVDVSLETHVVPGLPATAKDHEMVSGSPSGSEAVPASVSEEPSSTV